MNKSQSNLVPLCLKQLVPRSQYKHLVAVSKSKASRADYEKLKKKCDDVMSENLELKRKIEELEHNKRGEQQQQVVKKGRISLNNLTFAAKPKEFHGSGIVSDSSDDEATNSSNSKKHSDGYDLDQIKTNLEQNEGLEEPLQKDVPVTHLQKSVPTTSSSDRSASTSTPKISKSSPPGDISKYTVTYLLEERPQD